MLLSILQCTGQAPTTKKYLDQDIKSAEAENRYLRIAPTSSQRFSETGPRERVTRRAGVEEQPAWTPLTLRRRRQPRRCPWKARWPRRSPARPGRCRPQACLHCSDSGQLPSDPPGQSPSSAGRSEEENGHRARYLRLTDSLSSLG